MALTLDPVIKAHLIGLRSLFQKHGFDIRLVGGCVRDLLAGVTPNDFDLCTDANPEQQRHIYETYKVRHIDTGLHHGTNTVVIMDNVFEITSLRIDHDADGRHARVEYTKDWILDLSRRDLTINAMSLTLDDVLIDPYGGQDDLINHRVRFVGDAKLRITEDYLRILRWLRFHARFTNSEPRADLRLDSQTVTIVKNAQVKSGLKHISRERIWSEVSKIITGPHGKDMLHAINALELNEFIDLPFGSAINVALDNAFEFRCTAPAIMAAYVGSIKGVETLAAKWKWSNTERRESLLVALYGFSDGFDLIQAKIAVARDGKSLESLVQALYVAGQRTNAELLLTWQVPVFPVDGDDLISLGVESGRVMGNMLKAMKQTWTNDNFRTTREDLLATFDRAEINL